MGRKRVIKVRKREKIASNEREDLPEKYIDRGWSNWLKGPYAQVWYLIACFFLDVIVPLEISRHFDLTWAAFFSLIALFPLLILQMYLFNRIWGGLEFIFGR